MEGQKVYSELSVVKEKKLVTPWVLHVDGSSSSQRCGTRIVIVSLDRAEVSYLLRFELKAFNNKVEYEVVLVELKLAKSFV